MEPAGAAGERPWENAQSTRSSSSGSQSTAAVENDGINTAGAPSGALSVLAVTVAVSADPAAMEWTDVIDAKAGDCMVSTAKPSWITNWCEVAFDAVRLGTAWVKPPCMPRTTTWIVAPGCNCGCSYRKNNIKPSAHLSWMENLMHKVIPVFWHKRSRTMSQQLQFEPLNGGQEEKKLHADDEDVFQAMTQPARILSLSEGATIRFEMRKIHSTGNVHAVDMENGLTIVMEALSQQPASRDAGKGATRITLPGGGSPSTASGNK